MSGIIGKFNLYLHKFWNFLKPRHKLGLVSFVILSSLAIVVWFGSTNVAHAGVWELIIEGITAIIFAVAGFFIKLTFFILKFIIEIAGYNGFIDSSAVIVGWVMVRDITNMFFVVILLLISFGTILGLEQYEYKKLLVKLLLAAIIVNFSRVICGIIIDVAQVVMITFVNGIAATAAGNLVNMFSVDKIFKLSEDSAAIKNVSTSQQFLAAIAAITFSAIMMMTMLTFLFLLMARMVTLWILIVLSPFAFVLNVLPQTQKYAGQWWSEFSGNVIAGPIIAFFLWLSFVTVGAGNANEEIARDNPHAIEAGVTNQQETSVGLTSIMSWTAMANFAIAIGMLLAGAKMAQQLGAAGASMMSKAWEFGKNVATIAAGVTVARWIEGKGKAAGKGIGRGGLKLGDMGLAKVGLSTGDWKRRGRNIASWASYKTTKKGWFGMPSTESRLIGAKDRVETAYGEGERKIGQRFLAKLGLLFAPTAFREEYSKDKESRAKYAKQQMEHLVSTSKTPIGKEKTEAEAKLRELEATGQDIKSRKLSEIDEKSRQKRAEIDAELAGITDADKDVRKAKIEAKLDELEKKGKITDRQRFDYERWQSANKSSVQAEQMRETTEAVKARERAQIKEKESSSRERAKRDEKVAQEKAISKQIEDKLSAERSLKELQEIKRLLEGSGAKTQEEIYNKKAAIEQVNFEMGELSEQNIARARDEYLRRPDIDRDSEAVNLDNVIAKQTKARIERMSVGDYTLAMDRIVAQQQKVKDLEAKKDPRAKAALRSLSEMQMAAEGKGSVFAEGSMGKILENIGMSSDYSMDLEASNIRKLQAQWLASKINEQVKADKAGLASGMAKFRAIHGANAEAMLEQSRLALETGAGQGSVRFGGLLQTKVDINGKKSTDFTDVDDLREGHGLKYVAGRRTNALSGSKLTSLTGGVGGLVDRTKEGKNIVHSQGSIDTLSEILAPLTSNVLSNVDKFVKADLASIFTNSGDDKLKLLKNKLKENKNRKVVADLFTQVANVMKDVTTEEKAAKIRLQSIIKELES